jgi:hypothetical protein
MNPWEEALQILGVADLGTFTMVDRINRKHPGEIKYMLRELQMPAADPLVVVVVVKHVPRVPIRP